MCNDTESCSYDYVLRKLKIPLVGGFFLLSLLVKGDVSKRQRISVTKITPQVLGKGFLAPVIHFQPLILPTFLDRKTWFG